MIKEITGIITTLILVYMACLILIKLSIPIDKKIEEKKLEKEIEEAEKEWEEMKKNIK